MAGLVPAIHVFVFLQEKTWMPAPSAGMTTTGTAAFWLNMTKM